MYLLIVIIAQGVLSYEAYKIGHEWTNEFYSSWNSSSISIRKSVERNFNCCGFESRDDEMPSNWNETCPENELEKEKCCKLPNDKQYSQSGFSWNQTGQNCSVTQTRLNCCGAPDSCVFNLRLQTCFESISQFISKKLTLIIALGVTFGCWEIFGLLIGLLMTITIWKSVKEKEVGLKHYTLLDDFQDEHEPL